MLRPDGTFYRLQKGSNSSWKTADKSTLPLRCAATQTSSYYIIEVAIPWSSLALSNPPTDRRLAFTLECTDNRSGTVYTETIPDASQMRPYTWMEMRLGEMGEETGIEEPTPTAHPKGGETYDLLGHKVNSRSSLLATPSSKILIRNGKKYIAR
jgi:hypothetical protein